MSKPESHSEKGNLLGYGFIARKELISGYFPVEGFFDWSELAR